MCTGNWLELLKSLNLYLQRRKFPHADLRSNSKYQSTTGHIPVYKTPFVVRCVKAHQDHHGSYILYPVRTLRGWYPRAFLKSPLHMFTSRWAWYRELLQAIHQFDSFKAVFLAVLQSALPPSSDFCSCIFPGTRSPNVAIKSSMSCWSGAAVIDNAKMWNQDKRSYINCKTETAKYINLLSRI